MSQEQEAKRIFISYAHKDEPLREQLDTHLKLMQRQGLIVDWYDRHIQVGMEWRKEIDAHLEEATVILLLVSADFVASDYCYGLEMKRSLERHEAGQAIVLPILLRPADWKTAPFAHLQVLPRNGKAITTWNNSDEAFADIVLELRKVLTSSSHLRTSLSSASFSSVNLVSPSSRAVPPHNLPSRREFIGREKEMQEILKILSSPRHSLLSIVGMGGIGKTTLAIEVGHYCLSSNYTKLDMPFEAIAWISAEGRPEQKLWFNEVLDTIARVLGYLAITGLSQEQKILEIDQLLRTHRVLIVIDSFETIEDAELVKWIQLHVPEPSKTIITHRYNKIRKAYDIRLEGLEASEALELIHKYIRHFKWSSAKDTHDEQWQGLVQVTESNPGIIEMALGYIKRGKFSLAEVVKNLYTVSRSVDDLFRYLFARFWEEVLSEDAKHALLVLPFFADLVSKEALGATAGLMEYHLDFSLELLVELALLEVNSEQIMADLHYSIHPLTRAFAHSKLCEAPDFEEQARLRWCRYYEDFVRRSLIREQPKGYYWNTSASSGFKLVDSEWDNIRQVLIWVDEHEQQQILLDLVGILAPYMYRRFVQPFPKLQAFPKYRTR